MRTTTWCNTFFINFSPRDVVVSRTTGSPSARNTVLVYPSESTNSVHALTTKSLVVAHVESMPNTARTGSSFVRTKSKIESRREHLRPCVVGVDEDRHVTISGRNPNTRSESAKRSTCAVLCRREHALRVMGATEELTAKEVARAPLS